MSDREFLKTLKKGDKVIVHHGGLYRRESIGTVEKLTKTQIVVQVYGNETTHFRVDGGRQCGSSAYGSALLYEATPAEIERIREAILRKKLIQGITATDWESLLTPTLSAVMHLIQDAKEDVKND